MRTKRRSLMHSASTSASNKHRQSGKSREKVIPILSLILLLVLSTISFFQVNASSLSSSPHALTFDSSSRIRPQVVTIVPSGHFPAGVLYDPDNREVYVADFQSNKVNVFNSLTNTIITNVTVGGHPYALAYSHSDRAIYVTNQQTGTVSVINGTSNTVVATIIVMTTPAGIAYDPENKFIYVANVASGVISVIKHTHVRHTICCVPDAWGVAYDPVNGLIYVGSVGSNVTVINGTNIMLRIKAGQSPMFVSYDPASRAIWASNPTIFQPTIAVINSTSNQVIQTITGVGSPQQSAYSPRTGNMYVGDRFSHRVYELNGTTGAIVRTFACGRSPLWAAYDSANHRIYVSDYLSSNICIISH